MLEITASILSAYGRAASAALCARRSLEAATICMALVIFCVALVAAMRTRMSLRLAMGDQILRLTGPGLCERLCIVVDRGLELASDRVVKVAAGANGLQDIGVLGMDQMQQSGFERAYAIDRKCVEVPIDAGIDHDDLLFHLQRRELRLLEQFRQTRPAVQETLRRGVEVGA